MEEESNSCCVTCSSFSNVFFRCGCLICLRYKFTEFDPNKRLKRGAKKGSAKFKSKSKFKRKK